MTDNQHVTILRRKSVQARTGLPTSTLYDLIKNGTFPSPYNLGPRSVGWNESEVEEWIASRVKQTRHAFSQNRAKNGK